MWPWDATSTFILQRTFGPSLGLNFNLQTLEYISASGGPQPTLRISQNILLRWVSTSTWKFLKYFASLGLNLNLGILEIFCFAGISTSISKHLNYLRYKFWNHWVFLLLFKKKRYFNFNVIVIWLCVPCDLYGFKCQNVFMVALCPKFFNDHQGVHATSNLRPRVDIFVMCVMPHHMSG